MTALDDQTAWAVGSAGASQASIFHTTDGGATWNGSPNLGGRFLLDVALADARHGWAVGGQATILATTDGGLTWAVQTSPIYGDLYAVWFSDTLRGWAVGDYGLVSTIDGGATWLAQSESAIEYYRDITFADELHGWVVGQNGNALSTTDGGQSWQEDPLPSWNFQVHAVATVGVERWLVGENGLIIHAVGAFNPSPVAERPRAVLPEALALTAYPNPFNPATTLAFDLPAPAFVRLDLYDVQGRKVAKLLEGDQAAGRHIVRWDAAALPSGIYFARLDAGRRQAVRKLLLLK